MRVLEFEWHSAVATGRARVGAQVRAPRSLRRLVRRRDRVAVHSELLEDLRIGCDPVREGQVRGQEPLLVLLARRAEPGVAGLQYVLLVLVSLFVSDFGRDVAARPEDG